MRRAILKPSGKPSYSAVTYLVLYGLAIALPLLLLLGGLLLRSASLGQERLEQRMLQIVDILVDDLDRDFDRHQTILQTLATSQALDNEDWPSFYAQAKAALQGRAYIILIDATGRQLVNTYVPYGVQPAMTGDPETLRRILETKAAVISNLFTSLVVKAPVYNTSIPVLRDGKVRFVLSLGLLPSDLAALLSGQKLGPEWVTMVWDANGMILARSRENARHVGMPVPAQMRGYSQQAVFRTSNIDGVDVLHAIARSRIADWTAAVNVPYSIIAQDWRTSLLLWALAIVLAIALALIVGLLVARQISRPLSMASKAATALGRGQPFALTSSRLKEADIFLESLVVTQRELADRTTQLRKSEEQFHLAVESAPSGMILSDSEGRIVLINGQVEKMLGYSREELIGQKVEVLVPERFRAIHPDYRENYVAQPSMRPMGAGRDLFARRKDGTEVPVEIGLSPITTAQATMVLSTIVDITDHKQAQESQQLVIRELKHRTNNLLTVVEAIARSTIDDVRTLAEAKFVISGRLKALARAYGMLADAKWEGAVLRELLDRQFASVSNRISITNCNIV